MNAVGLLGGRIDRYEVQRLLGAGGFGAVYLAKHVHTDALAALKVLKKQVSAEPSIVERFLREAKAAAAVGSDAIVRVSDAGVSDEGQAFLVMEYLDGCDLKELAAREGPLPPMRIVNLVLQVLDGLQAAHQRNIVHRDMKPANVFVTRKEGAAEREVVKILDFGVSKMHADGATSGLTMSGMAMGTPSYMAPEQFFDARNVDGRADLYSVAVMLYELLSNRLPFDADSYAALIVKVRTEAPPPLQQIAPAVPPALANAVMVGLAKEKEKRWSSAAEFANALRSAVGLPQKSVAPVKVTGGPTPAPVVSDSASMMLGQTATPMPRAGQPIAPAPMAPAPAGTVSQRGPVKAQQTPSVMASPSLQADLRDPPVAAAPVAAAGQPPQSPQGPRAAAPAVPPAKKNNTLIIVLVVVGLIGFLGMCCVGTIVFAGIQAEQEKAARLRQGGTDEAPSPAATIDTPAAAHESPGREAHIRAMREATEELLQHEAAADGDEGGDTPDLH